MIGRFARNIEWAIAAGFLAASCFGCSPPDDEGDTGTDADSGPEAFHDDCTTTIEPQADAEATTTALERAFIEVEQGSVICMTDGTYRVKRELTLNEDGVTVRGESQEDTVLDFDAQQEGANGILVQSEKNFAALNFTIKNTASDSLKVKDVDGVVMKNLTVTWDRGASTKNGAYALYPVESKNVLIEGSKVSYCRDAGVYLGQSDTAIIRNNEAFGNVVGIEIENTFRAEAYDNHAHGNTDGFLVINLPDLMVKGGGKNLVYDNKIVDNNRENFGEEGTAVSNMPQGSGLILLASNNNEFRNNTIKNNQSIGLGVGSYFLIDSKGSGDAEYDPYSQGNWLHDNKLVGNGSDPQGTAEIAKRPSDGTAPQIFWEGRYDTEADNSDGELTNCFENNKDGSDQVIDPVILDTTEECPNPPSDAKSCQIKCSGSSVSSVELPDRVMEMAGYDPSEGS